MVTVCFYAPLKYSHSVRGGYASGSQLPHSPHFCHGVQRVPGGKIRSDEYTNKPTNEQTRQMAMAVYLLADVIIAENRASTRITSSCCRPIVAAAVVIVTQ